MPLVFAGAFHKLARMWKWCLFLPVLAAVPTGWAQTGASAIDVANLREDVRDLSQRVADLSLRVDQLESANRTLRDQAKSPSPDAVTLAQLNDALAELHRTVQAEIAAAQAAAVREVGTRSEKEVRPAAAAPGSPASAPGAGTFSTGFPKEGINYTVQKGETLALIAKQTGAKLSDIINANKLADPSRIRVGQVLFIPGGK